jgi:hypothetical protein
MTRAARVLAVVLLVALAAPRAAAVGTLDLLVDGIDAKLADVLAKHRREQIDLALALRRGGEVTPGLLHVVRDLLLGRLANRGLRSAAQIPAVGGGEERRRRAREGGFELLLDLELVVVDGHLHLRGTVVPTDRLLWRDILQPDRGALHHLAARVRVDAEVRGYQGNVSAGTLRFSPRPFPLGRREVLALDVGDLDGDGRSEVLALGPRALRALRYRGAQGFVQFQATPLVPPWAQLLTRRPVGSLVATDLDRDGRAEVLLRTSEMERGAVFVLAGKHLQRKEKAEVAGYPLVVRALAVATKGKQKKTQTKVEQLLGQLVAGQDLLEASTLAGALELLPGGSAVGLPQTFYRLKLATIAKKGGERKEILGLVDDNGRLQLYADRGTTPVVQMQNVGAIFDMVDLDDDGALELVTTSAGGPGEKDQITVYRLEGGAGVPRQLWRSAALGGIVTALAHGDLDGDGKLELLAALREPAGTTQLLLLN